MPWLPNPADLATEPGRVPGFFVCVYLLHTVYLLG